MYIYNIVYGINFFLGLLDIGFNKKFLKISFIILCVFLNLNYLNGIDWVQWQQNYMQLSTLDTVVFENAELGAPNRNSSEVLFFLLMSLFKALSFNYEMFQFIILTFCQWIIYKFISQNTKYPLVVVLIYFSDFLLGNFFEPALRQILALVCFYLSIPSIQKENKIKYILYIFLAMLFHKSAVILFFMYFFNKKIISKILPYIYLSSIVIISMLDKIVKFIFLYIPFFSKYEVYLLSEEYGIKSEVSLLKILIRVVLIMMLYIFIKRNMKKYQNMKNFQTIDLYLNFFLIGEIFWIFSQKIFIFFRMTYYYKIFFAIIFVLFLDFFIRKYKIKLGIIMYLLFSCYFYYFMYKSINYWNDRDRLKFFPYTNYLFEVFKNDNEIKTDEQKIKYRLEKKNEKNKN